MARLIPLKLEVVREAGAAGDDVDPVSDKDPFAAAILLFFFLC